MWPFSGTFFRCCRAWCSQVSSHINDSLWCFTGEKIKKRTTTRARDCLCYIKGKTPEKDTGWIWNKFHQKKSDTARFYILTGRDLNGQVHETHCLVLSVTELYYGCYLNIHFCQEKNELKSTTYGWAVVFSGFMLGFGCEFGILLFSFYYLKQWRG